MKNLVLTTLALFLLAGCGGSDSSNGTPAEDSGAAEAVSSMKAIGEDVTDKARGTMDDAVSAAKNGASNLGEEGQALMDKAASSSEELMSKAASGSEDLMQKASTESGQLMDKAAEEARILEEKARKKLQGN